MVPEVVVDADDIGIPPAGPRRYSTRDDGYRLELVGNR
jgi:hypothetical protein